MRDFSQTKWKFLYDAFLFIFYFSAQIFIVSTPPAVILATFLLSDFYTNNIFVESNIVLIPIVNPRY